MSSKHLWIGLLICAFVTSASVGADEGRGHDDEVEFLVVAEGGQSGIDHQMSMVVDNQMHWEHLWKMHTKGSNEPPMPKVDFGTDMVIAQFLGSVASCGYDIQTKEVEDKGDYLKVETAIQLPIGDIFCLVAEQPFEMISVPRTNTIVQFKLDVDD